VVSLGSTRLLLLGRAPFVASRVGAAPKDVADDDAWGTDTDLAISEQRVPAAEDKTGSPSKLKSGSAANRLYMGFCATMMGDECIINNFEAAEPRS